MRTWQPPSITAYVSLLDDESLFESHGEPSAREKARELAALMHTGIQSEGGQLRTAEHLSTPFRKWMPAQKLCLRQVICPAPMQVTKQCS